MNTRNVQQVNLRIIKEKPQSILEVHVIAVQITRFSVLFFTQPLERKIGSTALKKQKTNKMEKRLPVGIPQTNVHMHDQFCLHFFYTSSSKNLLPWLHTLVFSPWFWIREGGMQAFYVGFRSLII